MVNRCPSGHRIDIVDILPAPGSGNVNFDRPVLCQYRIALPYLHEETFRETYAQLKHDNAATRRTWLGVLNMVLAMATHTTVLQMGQAERQRQSEAFYRRANGLCAEHVMNGASVEIGQFCLQNSCCATFIVMLISNQSSSYFLSVSTCKGPDRLFKRGPHMASLSK